MIVTVTFNPAVDHTALVDEDLEPGTVARGHDAVFDAAGKGINAAKYMTGLGVDSIATGPVGGFLGDFLEDDLDAQDVPHDFVRIDGLTRLNTTIDAPDAEYKVNLDGPEMLDGIEDQLLAAVERHDPDVVVMGGSLPPGMDATVITRIMDGDWRTVVDVHGDVLRRISGSFFLAKPNREELREATGLPVDSINDVVAAADELCDQGIENVLVSLGEKGAVFVTEDSALYADALDVDVADTVGAGDAIVAGVIAALERGGGLEEMLRDGIAVASRVVQVSGVRTPEFDDLDVVRDRVTVERLR
ncbi:MAG: 1-phosphofructokinase family hexose kinase [Candidatus Nanohaloarchaea archaeon]|nr:1-phosphofructokinase family hexose kinase [Candidatus Nanohaloarchaea archaeon]